MKMVVASLVGFSIFTAGTLAFVGAGIAASPDECILVARAFAIAKAVNAPPGTTAARSRQEIQNDAYASCVAAAATSAEPDLQIPAVGEAVPAARPVRKLPTPRVSAYADAPARATSGRAARAISKVIREVPVARLDPLSGIEPASCIPTAGATRFWRSLTFRATAPSC